MAERDGRQEWLAQQLKAEANRHEPDLDRIRQRIRERERDQPARRSAWLLPAAAATFVILTAGAITAVHNGRAKDPVGQVAVVPAGSGTAAPSTPVAPATRDARPTPPSAVHKPTGSATTGVPQQTKPPVSPTTTTSTRPARPDGIGVELVTASAGQEVSLPSGAVDWIAAGSQSAEQTVRSVSGGQQISGPHETGTATSTTTDSPFSVSWTGGLSEPSHSRSSKWRTVTGPANGPETGLIVRVPAGRHESTLVLYIGAGGENAELRTSLGTQGKVTKTGLKALDGGGYVATIRFKTSGPDDELTAELVCGSGGSISLAAAALR